MPTISEIQDYLSQQETDEPIAKKAEYRVTRAMAENVKNITALPKGRCNLCSREDDRLVPVTMKICMTCANRFIKRGAGLRVIKKEFLDYHCDNCLVRTFVTFYVNPNACRQCARTIGNTHKFEGKEAAQERKKIDKYKQDHNIKVQVEG